MKQFYLILFLFFSTDFFSSVASASFSVETPSPTLPFKDDPAFDLCDASCDLTISFPYGGTLTATDILLINFGSGGVVSLGEGGSLNVSAPPESLEYPAGGTLFLTTGESITFGVGGFINTAVSGNFKYRNIEVTTDVDFDAILDVGSTEINLFNITATGTGEATISTNGIINVVGTLESSEAGFNLTGIVSDSLPQLCDVSCELMISFPNGGTFTAIEGLRIYFGNGGFLDLGDTGTVNAATQPGTLEFPTGGSFVLDAGESITFDVGGSIKTASGGNFSYTDIEVTTDVYFDVVLDEGAASINIYDITAMGNGVISIVADGIINVSGILSAGDASLIFSSESTINLTGTIDITGNTGVTTAECTSSSVGGSSVTLTSSTLNTGTVTNCIGTIGGSATTEGTITLNGVPIVTGGLTTEGTITLNGAPIVGGELTLAGGEAGSNVADDDRVSKGSAGSLDWMTIGLFLLFFVFYTSRRNFSIR